MPTGTRPDPPDGSVRVAISGTYLGHKFVNVLWLLLTHSGTPDPADLTNVLTSLAASYNTQFLAHVGQFASVTEVRGEWWLGTGNLGVIVPRSDSGARTTTYVADASACYLINWQISASYRGGHPRTYLPGVMDSDVTNGAQINAGQRSTLSASAAAFLSAVNALTHGGVSAVKLGTVSFVDAKAWRAPPVFRPFNSGSCNLFLGSQRRRIRA